MRGLFGQRDKSERLIKVYEKRMKVGHTLSTVNRMASDKKYVEDHVVTDKLEDLRKKAGRV
jgi:hypothetical protein